MNGRGEKGGTGCKEEWKGGIKGRSEGGGFKSKGELKATPENGKDQGVQLRKRGEIRGRKFQLKKFDFLFWHSQ